MKPTFNHTRGDSRLTPCPECKAAIENGRIANGSARYLFPQLQGLSSIQVPNGSVLGEVVLVCLRCSCRVTVYQPPVQDNESYWMAVIYSDRIPTCPCVSHFPVQSDTWEDERIVIGDRRISLSPTTVPDETE